MIFMLYTSKVLLYVRTLLVVIICSMHTLLVLLSVCILATS